MEELVIKIEVPEELKEEYKKVLEEEIKLLKSKHLAKVLDKLVKKSKLDVESKEFEELIKEIKEGIAKRHGIERG